MANQTIKKSNLKGIFMYAVGIALFILAESRHSFLLGNWKQRIAFIVFYAFDISYFFFSLRIYLPVIYQRFSARLYRYVFMGLWIFGYSILLCFISDLLHCIFTNQINFKINSADLEKGGRRSLLLFAFAFAIWQLRYGLLQEIELNKKNIALKTSANRFLAIENDLLRSQVDPHFLFNALTSIHRKTAEVAPNAAVSIQLLAELMDYSLLKSDENGLVSLQKDLQQIQTYIQLNQELNRHCLQLLVTMEIFNGNEFKIVPLLLFTFIANIFKHGDLTDHEEPAYITVSITGAVLKLYCQNKILATPQSPSRNIGMENAKRRLDNYYPGLYKLDTDQKNGKFYLTLFLTLCT